MKPQTFVRPLTEDERTTLESGRRAPDAFTVRRCHILLASAEGQSPSTIASHLRCARQTVYNGLEAFAERGLDCLRLGSHVPVSVSPVLTAEKREHPSKPAQLWQGAKPLDLATACHRLS